MRTGWRSAAVAVVAACAAIPMIGTADADASLHSIDLAAATCQPPAPGQYGYVANLVDHSISIVDLANNSVTGIIRGFRFPWNVESTFDGSLLYVDDAPPEDPTASAVDVVSACSDTIIKRIPTLGLGFSSLAPNGRDLFTANIATDGIQEIDTATSKVVARFLTTPLPQEAVSADGHTLWVIALPNLAYAINMQTGLIDDVPLNVGLGSAQFSISPNGAMLGVADLDGDVAIVNTHTKTVAATVDLGALSYPSFATFSPDSRYLWVGTYSGLVAVIDLKTDQVVHTLDTGGWVTGVTLSGDGKTAYVSTTPAESIVPSLGVAYLTPVLLSQWRVGGMVRVFNTQSFAQTAVIPTGNVPMGMSIP